MMTIFVILSACSQDDDGYESDMYTVANECTTRSGGDPGGSENFIYTHLFQRGFEFKRDDNDSLIVNSNVVLNLRYDKTLGTGSIDYIRHDNENLFNLRVEGYLQEKGMYLHFSATVYANMIIEHDTLPNETILVRDKKTGNYRLKDLTVE